MAALKLLKFLRPSCVVPKLEAENKEDAIEELIAALEAEGLLGDAEQVRADVFAREEQMSTGLTEGLAIPHAKSVGARDITVAVGLKPEGIDFESLDGKPAQAVFLVVSRADYAGPHLECLAEIAQFYSRPEARQRLLKATTTRQILETLES